MKALIDNLQQSQSKLQQSREEEQIIDPNNLVLELLSPEQTLKVFKRFLGKILESQEMQKRLRKCKEFKILFNK